MKLFGKDLYRSMVIGFLIGSVGMGFSIISSQAQAAAPVHMSAAASVAR